MAGTPGAPGPRCGAVSAAGAVGLSHAAIAVRGVALAGQGAVANRVAGFDRAVEPGAQAVGGRRSNGLSGGSLLVSL